MFRAIISSIFRSTTLGVRACGIMHTRCCRPPTGNIMCALYHISTAPQSTINSNAHCRTFSISDQKCVHLMGQHCPVHQLKVKQVIPPLTQTLTCVSVLIPLGGVLLSQQAYIHDIFPYWCHSSKTSSEACQSSKESHRQQLLNLTFRGSCIVIQSSNKSQQDELFLKFILVKNSVSDRTTVHHQEFQHSVHRNRYFSC